MAAPSSPALQKLRHLDTLSPDFPSKLREVLYGEEYYARYVSHLGNGDLTWFIDYLDEVRGSISPLSPRSRRRRLSIVWNLPVPHPGSVYVN